MPWVIMSTARRLSVPLLLLLVWLAAAPARALPPTEVFARVAPATVVIVALGPGDGLSLGSGAIVTPGGLLLTNYHVIRPGLMTGRLVAFLYDPNERTSEENFAQYLRTHIDRARPLSVRRIDEENDLAVLALPPGVPYPSVPLGDSDVVQVGESVLAIGTPHGLTWSLTPGLISSLRKNSLQTSAAINPGNSGGPLVDMNGRLLGINTYIREGQGLGFARPVNLVRPLLAAAEAMRPPPGAIPPGAIPPGAIPPGAPPSPLPSPGPGPGKAEGGWTPGRYMTEAVANVLKSAVEVSGRSAYGFDADVSILGAFLRPGRTVSVTRRLERGVAYALLGGGDSGAQDVDIVVRSEDGTVIAVDRDDDATPGLGFRVPVTGRYVITLALERAGRGSFCALVVMREGGYDVPVQNLRTAMINAITQGYRVNQKGGGARFHQEDNQWSLFGSILRQGESITISGLTMEEGNHAVLATGDESARDLDLYLIDEDDDVVGKDEDDDATPVVAGRTGGRYAMRLANQRSRGAALTIAMILDF
jgi:S1-C subfamily serine protease